MKRNQLVAFWLAIPAVVIVLGGCGGGLPSEVAEDAAGRNVALLDWSGVGTPPVRFIDAEPVDDSATWAEISPGWHEAFVQDERGQSILLGSMWVEVRAPLEFYAEPGRRYRVRYEKAYTVAAGHYIWLEDTETGAILAGRAPPGTIEDENSAYYAGRARMRTAADYYDTEAAAHCGDAEAQYRLSLFLLAGIEPVEQPDAAEAYAWIARAARNGHREAERVRRRLWADLSPQQRARADTLATALPTAPCDAPRVANRREGET